MKTTDDRGRGTIITFYSYKGGTGRTMALVNTAWILASNGLRVLVVDWDLEAPGLHTYLQPLLADPDLTESPGVIEMVRNFTREAVEPPVGSLVDNGGMTSHPPDRRPAGGDMAWYREQARVDQYAVGTDLRLPEGGKLDLLPAGVQDPDTYAVTVGTFDWGAFYRMGGDSFLTVLREEMAARYDYVLIDSRTGLSDTAGICTVVLPDIVVDCFTLSHQGVDGAVRVAHSIRRNAHAQRDIRIVPVPMRVEDAGRDRLEAGRFQARKLLAPFLDWMPADEQDLYWSTVEVPYKPSYAYEEIPATVGERRQDGTLLASFERLTARLTDHRVSELRNMPEPYRQTLLREYERTSPVVRKDFYVSYAADDRLWAEWVVAVLGAAGHEARLASVEAEASSTVLTGVDRTLAGESRLVALLSPHYAASPRTREIWRRVTRKDPTGTLGMVVPLRVDESVPSPEFASPPAFNLTGVSADEAEARLLAAVGVEGDAARSLHRNGTSLAYNRGRLPGSTPAVSKLPLRNATFTGRRAIIERLRDSLLTGPTAVLPQALYGLGGVGKTALALEYAHRFAADYDVVWWINAAQPQEIRKSLEDLAGRLGLPRGNDMAATCEAVLEALRSGLPYSRWLLIYDNAENAEDLESLVPASGPGHHVLITSRNPAWAQQAEPVEVDLFTREESIDLLRRYNRGLEESEAARVAQELGDLPLAVSQAAAWLQNSATPVDTYVDMLRTQLANVLQNQSGSGYPEPAAATWLLSVDQLKRRLPAAAELLYLCAFFGPDPIPRDLLNSAPALELLTRHDPGLTDPLLMGRLYGEVNRNGLAQIDQGAGTITVHRLVQAVLRDQFSEEDQRAMRARVHTILADANPKSPDEASNWSRYAELLPHLWPTHAEESDSPQVRQWICDTVRYLWQRGDATTAHETAERVLARWTSAYGADDPLVLRLRTELGNALRSHGRLKEAFDVTKDTHARAVRTLGEDHPYTLAAAMSLGGDLRGDGRYAEAMELDRVTVRLVRQAFGEGHQRALSAANNLAVSEYLSGNRRSARETNKELVRLSREILGYDDQLSLIFALNYARSLRDAGELRQALKLLRDTLDRCRRALGSDHVVTLRASLDTAILLRRTGTYEAAYELTAETYERSLARLGPEHPGTLATAINLAADLVNAGEPSRARTIAEETLGRYTRRFGPEHLFTLACATDLAVLLRLTGEPDAALELSTRTLERYRSLLGDDRHPYVLTCMINHATALAETGDQAAAVSTGRKAHEGLRAVLGASHFLTLTCASNLAIDLRRDSPEEARRLHDEAEHQAQVGKELGGEHPLTRLITAWRRVDADIEPPVT